MMCVCVFWKCYVVNVGDIMVFIIVRVERVKMYLLYHVFCICSMNKYLKL